MDWREGVRFFTRIYPDARFPEQEPDGQSPRNFLANEANDKQPGLPQLFFDCSPLAKRVHRGWFWCPDGLPAGRPVALASSRLGRAAFEDAEVADALRAFFCALTGDLLVVTTDRATLDETVRRGSRLFSTPLVRWIPFPRWLSVDDARALARRNPDRLEFRVYYDSRIHSDRDRLLFSCCEQLRVLSVRKEGNLLRLLRELLTGNGAKPETRVFLLANDRLTSPGVRDELHELGCHDWWLWREGEIRQVSRLSSRGAARIVPFGELSGTMLSHWTRRRTVARKEPSGESPWDAALLGTGVAIGPFASLCRILASQVIYGGGQLIRGGRPVCCFTGVPLCEFRDRRVFRPHLARYDFEPYGIAVRCEALKRLGGLPVRYVPAEALTRAERDERAWMVVGDSARNWQDEQEWRVVGNVDLRQLSPDEAVVFVPSQEDAEVVCRLSRWPVTILPAIR